MQVVIDRIPHLKRIIKNLFIKVLIGELMEFVRLQDTLYIGKLWRLSDSKTAVVFQNGLVFYVFHIQTCKRDLPSKPITQSYKDPQSFTYLN